MSRPEGQPGRVDLLLSASDDSTIRVWDVPSGTCTRTLAGHEGMVQGLADLGHGLVASAESQDLVLIWQLSLAGTAPGETPGGAVRGLAIAAPWAVAVRMCQRRRRLDTGVLPLETELRRHTGPVSGVAVGAGGSDRISWY